MSQHDIAADDHIETTQRSSVSIPISAFHPQSSLLHPASGAPASTTSSSTPFSTPRLRHRSSGQLSPTRKKAARMATIAAHGKAVAASSVRGLHRFWGSLKKEGWSHEFTCSLVVAVLGVMLCVWAIFCFTTNEYEKGEMILLEVKNAKRNYDDFVKERFANLSVNVLTQEEDRWHKGRLEQIPYPACAEVIGQDGYTSIGHAVRGNDLFQSPDSFTKTKSSLMFAWSSMMNSKWGTVSFKDVDILKTTTFSVGSWKVCQYQKHGVYKSLQNGIVCTTYSSLDEFCITLDMEEDGSFLFDKFMQCPYHSKHAEYATLPSTHDNKPPQDGFSFVNTKVRVLPSADPCVVLHTLTSGTMQTGMSRSDYERLGIVLIIFGGLCMIPLVIILYSAYKKAEISGPHPGAVGYEMIQQYEDDTEDDMPPSPADDHKDLDDETLHRRQIDDDGDWA
eukprot:TRINITY_DN970_c0_g1_i1.p1 TRINITY_DN970_c0_g1~~TRINITY_DN970_c0_g1_i1.p1  ORF type:complete len:449 (-),score=98.57 TRINITY_DN970_c0_g1_i1:736-2082(-)